MAGELLWSGLFDTTKIQPFRYFPTESSPKLNAKNIGVLYSFQVSQAHDREQRQVMHQKGY